MFSVSTTDHCPGGVYHYPQLAPLARTRRKPFDFPFKLHQMLEEACDEGYDHIVSWLPNGRAFRIHRRDDFAKTILPRYFSTTKIRSFLRQLNIYSFNRVDQVQSVFYGAYWHKLFVRSNPDLCFGMERTKNKSSANTQTMTAVLPWRENHQYNEVVSSSMLVNIGGFATTPTAVSKQESCPAASRSRTMASSTDSIKLVPGSPVRSGVNLAQNSVNSSLQAEGADKNADHLLERTSILLDSALQFSRRSSVLCEGDHRGHHSSAASYHQEALVTPHGLTSRYDCQEHEGDDELGCNPFDDADWDYPQLQDRRKVSV